MTAILPLCFFAILCVILQRLGGELAPKFKGFLACGAGCVFFLLWVRYLAPFFSYLNTLISQTELQEPFSLLLKALGIALVTSVSASICRDLGEEGVAAKLEVCAKGVILSLSLPLLKQILQFVGEMTS